MLIPVTFINRKGDAIIGNKAARDETFRLKHFGKRIILVFVKTV